MGNLKIIKLLLSLLLVGAYIIFLFCGCSNSNNQGVENKNKTEELYIDDDSEKDFISTAPYKYINGYATFSYEFKDDYVVFTDNDYSEGETYYGKVRWCDNSGEGTIVSVSQVISADGKEIYNKQLEIIDLRNENENNHVWDYISNCEYSVKAKCNENADVKCYIKLIDSNGIEYHVMLIPIEKFNDDEYAGAAVYIIDKGNNTKFWYDDLTK
ncbi:MAG: hypothetical protein J1E36_04955 [Eubacterium sp.]|nr:hypothetical protein [Eubacterium sp.]